MYQTLPSSGFRSEHQEKASLPAIKGHLFLSQKYITYTSRHYAIILLEIEQLDEYVATSRQRLVVGRDRPRRLEALQQHRWSTRQYHICVGIHTPLPDGP